MMNKIVLYAFYSCALFLTDVGGTITQRPSNMATNVGGQAVFNCTSSSNATVPINWIYSTLCNTGGSTLTQNNCEIHSNYASNYRTEKPDGLTCNLIISRASLSLGGCYTCADGFGGGNIYHGMLVVVESNASIIINGTEWLSGENVTISSNVTHRGASIPQQPIPLPPSFYWTLLSDTSQNISSYPGETTNTSASSYIIVAAQTPYIPQYECHLFFNLPLYVPPDCASNAPTYTNFTVTPLYPVSYLSEIVQVSEPTNLCQGAPVELSCSATGYPTPTCNWYNVTSGKLLSDNCTIRIESAGSYQCNASNTIRNVNYTASSIVIVVAESCVNPKKSTPLCENLGASVCYAILVIVIYFGLNLLFFTIFITCYACSENGRNTMNDRFPWLKKMLPCVNSEGCKCSIWIFYFVLLSIFAAFIFFPTIMIMASCCEKTKKKSSQGNMQLNDRSGRGAGNTQVNNRGTTPNQSPPRLSVTPNPPSSLHTTVHYQQDPPSRPYPHSSNQQLQPTYSNYTDPYPRNLRQTPSPALSTGGVVYAELGVDNKPMSRRPIQPIINDGNAYADIALA